MSDGSTRASRRAVIVAVLLSGLGPGAGHVHAGHPWRGLVFVAAWLITSLAWVAHVADSFHAAQLWALPPALSLLALIIDSGRVAGREPPGGRGPLQRWWCTALIIVVTGLIVPLALTRALARRVQVVMLADSSMEPQLQALDRIVMRRELAGLERGSVVGLAGEGDSWRLRRVVGLPGETIDLRGGHIHVNSQPWLRDPARLAGRGRESMKPVTLGPDEYLVLPDQRMPGSATGGRLPRSQLAGIAAWVLLPADRDPMRLGATVQ